jgi:hypothetical protein
MSQRDKRDETGSSRPTTSGMAVARNRPKAGAGAACGAAWHASYHKLTHAYLDAYGTR